MPKLLSSGQKDSIIHALGQGLKVLLCKGFKGHGGLAATKTPTNLEDPPSPNVSRIVEYKY
jgi:hypothetical protein